MNEKYKSIESTITLFALLGLQLLIFLWQRFHKSTFDLFSLAGLLFVPLLQSINLAFTRFIVIWLVINSLNTFALYKSFNRPLQPLVPRLVYKWFTFMHQLCIIIGCIGYALLLMITFGLKLEGNISLLFMFYGLYFGTLNRDFACICNEKMARTIGYFSDGIATRQLKNGICAICDDYIKIEGEAMIQLTCGHQFHNKCIRGWCIIGKQDCCPYCKEKVDLKDLSDTPWETQQALYLALLDWLKYVLVWIPLLGFLLHTTFKLMGFE